MRHLIYIADPMCSWCYGFGPELATFFAGGPETQLDLLMGGLRAYNSDIMNTAMKDMLRDHWQHVGQASGLPFSHGILERTDFVYDTEPACRAVVVARSQAPQHALEYLHAVQTAFYRDSRDVTRGEVLADIAGEIGLPRNVFYAAWNSDEARAAARQDFANSQRLGVEGFPTLALLVNDALYLVANGFTRATELIDRTARIEKLAAEQTVAAGSP
jgi:putative protein-disulfide isomerase